MTPASEAPAHGLSRAAIEGEAILRVLAKPSPPSAQVTIAVEAGRPTKNIGRELQQLREASLIDAGNELTAAGRNAVAALDRATQGTAARVLTHADITPDPDQPRKHFDDAALDELADSIAEHGLLQPIVLRPAGDRHMIIGGERRWRAIGRLIERCEWAVLDPVPHTVRQMDDAQAAVAALMENVQRADLTALEKLDAYQRLIALNPDWSAEDATQHLADLIKKSRRHVQDILRLALLTSGERQLMAAGDLTLEQARGQLKNRKPPIEMDPREVLVLAEVYDRANGFDPQPTFTRQADCSPTATLDDPVAAAMVDRELLAFPATPADDGQFKVGLTLAGWHALQQLAPDTLKAERSGAILALRARVVGADAAEHADETGRSVTGWLNGPFPLTPEGQAKLDAAEAEAKAQADEDQLRRDQRAQYAAEVADRRRKAETVAMGLPTRPAGSTAVDIRGLADEAGHPLPWAFAPYDPATGAGGYILDADGKPVDLEGDGSDLLPLVMAALNAAIGEAPKLVEAAAAEADRTTQPEPM